MYRNKNCGELNIKNVGENVVIAGWVQRIRNLGSMKFIDLRDQFGITQIIVNDNCADNLVTECVIQVDGTVIERTNKNSKIPTGEIEIEAKKIEVLGTCKNILPFEVNSEKAADAREDLRLEYRFLDLRNEKLHKTIILRSEIMKTIRNKMDELGFTEIQTPILANSSPEGARDFLVPSRLHPGEFYALPQAPQQFKQLLMVSGFDKYYQIAPCFRDEDPRADRAPGEFYQLDFEMSFAEQKDVLSVLEDIFTTIFKKHTNWKITDTPFPRIPYKEAMERYGSDKPDLRNPLIIQDVTQLFKDTEFNAFKGKTIKAIIVENGAEQGRKFFDNMGEYAVNELEAKGLAWVKFEKENEITGGIAKFITKEIKKGLEEIGAKPNVAIFFIADEFKNHYFSNPYSVTARDIDAYYEAAHLGDSPKSVYASVKCNYTKCNIINALKKIDNSIYLLGGDHLTGMEKILEEYKNYNPAIESIMIPDTKHLPQLEAPAAFHEMCETFLE